MVRTLQTGSLAEFDGTLLMHTALVWSGWPDGSNQPSRARFAFRTWYALRTCDAWGTLLSPETTLPRGTDCTNSNSLASREYIAINVKVSSHYIQL